MLVVQRKLKCTGWAYLVQFLRSSYKLFAPDHPWPFYRHMVPFGGWRLRAPVYFVLYIKCQKVQKIVTLVMASWAYVYLVV